jgi:signal peptidase I
MNFQELKSKIKKSWNWIWNSDSIWSWIVALILIFLIVKFIFFPALSLIFGTSLPLAGVESSSMDHQIVKDDSGGFSLCGEIYSEEQKKEIGNINFNEYWDICGGWYIDNKHITKPIFENFLMKNGFSKGDIIIVWGRFTPKIGDIIIFKPNSDSTAPRPIIHRIVEINGQGIIQTKGDHNKEQLTFSNNLYQTDETNIKKEQIIGKAIFKIPYLGWIKIWFVELINFFR